MKRKFLLKNGIKLTGTAILLILLFRKVNIDDLQKAAGVISNRDLLACICIYFISVLLNALKWKILLREISILQLFKICLKAQLYSVVLPGQLFGEAAKVIELKDGRAKQGRIVSSVIVDKVTSLTGSIVVGFTGLFFTEITIPDTLRVWFLLFLFLLFFILSADRMEFVNHGIVFVSYRLWRYPVLKRKNAGRKIYRLYAVWKSCADCGSVLLLSVILGVCNQMLGNLQVWMISSGMGLPVSYMEYCWIMPAVSVILLLPVSFGGLGIREVSFGGFLSLFGVAYEEAVVISVILLIAQVSAAFAGFLIIGYDWMKRLKQEKDLDRL